MQAQDATTVFFLKLWPRIEANKNRLIAGAAIIAIVIFSAWIFSVQRAQKETAAGEALTQLDISQTATPEAYLKIATDNPATAAGQRALLQGATMLFAAGKYSDAQTQFQKFSDTYPDNEFAAQAALGVAKSLDAQGKTDLAASAYQRLLNNPSDAVVLNTAKLALAKILEAQGKYDNAMVYYQDVMRANANNSLGSDAMWHVMQLKNKMPAAPVSPATAPTAAPLPLSK